MSDNQPSGTLGGLLSSLFGRRNSEENTESRSFSSKHKILSGALLAAGAAYLYKRAKNKQTMLG
jgi:hypothetical protein